MKIIIFDGTFKTTTFINRLMRSLSINHQVFVIGFNEEINNKIEGVQYIGLGSNDSRLLFIIRSIQLRGFSIRKLVNLFGDLVSGNKSKIRQQNIQHAIDLVQPDILHFQWLSLLIYLPNLKISSNTKTVLSQRGYQINITPFIDQDNFYFLEKIFKSIDGFHSVSKAIKEVSNKIYTSPTKIDKVVYSGFYISEFRSKVDNVFPKTINIISVGRDHWKKDYRTAILAMNLLKKDNINFHYTIVGVQKSEELLYLVDELGLYEHVTFIDRIPQEEVYEKMLSSDIFLLPSIEEGIANVCIEAMFCKLPVVSTNCGGMSELITNGETGYLVPTRNPEAIAKSIKAIVKKDVNEINTLVSNAYKKASKQHSNETMVNGMEDLYNSVLKKKV